MRPISAMGLETFLFRGVWMAQWVNKDVPPKAQGRNGRQGQKHSRNKDQVRTKEPKSVKRGNCPEDRLRCLSPIQHLCNKDSDCRGSSRCCLGACGRDCRNPV
uniref:WAP four-disulfide core domain 5 n=1 Tax=Neovison vison TaxID=452646 RepID=A0A8C7ATW7_NEOVI